MKKDTVGFHIRNLRKKNFVIQTLTFSIDSVREIGYRFKQSVSSPLVVS